MLDATPFYKIQAAIASTPAATPPKLTAFVAADPVNGTGVELDVVVLLLLLVLLVELLTGRKFAQVRRVVL